MLPGHTRRGKPNSDHAVPTAATYTCRGLASDTVHIITVVVPKTP